MRTPRKLICKLTKCFISEEHDFIPAGAPVEVLSWSENKTNHLLCRTKVHIFVDSIPSDLSSFDGNVNGGLYIDIPAECLNYDDHQYNYVS